MKRLFFQDGCHRGGVQSILQFLLAMLLPAVPSFAGHTPAVRNVDISVSLSRDGSAHITEIWDVTVAGGTEWYLVRDNLGDISIENFCVKDETGRVFMFEGEWDTGRDLAQKAGRCGIVSKRDGCELCWGVGSYGDHIFTVSYTMTNLVKSMEDADMLHVQFISPGLSSPPLHAATVVSLDSASFAGACQSLPVIDTSCARVWGFGFEGELSISGGRLSAESGEPFTSNSSMIILARFDKGIFSSSSNVDGTFEEHLQKALEGSDYGTGDDDISWKVLLGMLGGVAGLTALIIVCNNVSERRRNRKMFGVSKLSDIMWSREVPFGGAVLPSYRVMDKIGKGKINNLASAMILEMVQKGMISVARDSKERVLLSFNDSVERDSIPSSFRMLYDMMHQASGEDSILQHKEFSKWSGKHSDKLKEWCTVVEADAIESISNGGYVDAESYNAEGQENARRTVGLMKFLKDATLVRERSTAEVVLWREYMIFASLYGIADKVARELKDINPQAFEEAMKCDCVTACSVLSLSNVLGSSITKSVAGAEALRGSGAGGAASFGGGGGFSGGGFGGGSR